VGCSFLTCRFDLGRCWICALAGASSVSGCFRVFPYVRTVRTSSGATAVQIVYSDVLTYFNNDGGAIAVGNARTLRAMLGH
jgi:hypothetical protein